MVDKFHLKTFLISLGLAVSMIWSGHAHSASALDGYWQVTEALGSAGPYGLGTFNESRNEVSKSVEIAAPSVRVGNAACRIENSETVTLSDYEFGNEEGDWSSLGFTAASNTPYEYEAVQVNVSCPGQIQSEREILIGAGGAPVILNYWETWLKLERIKP